MSKSKISILIADNSPPEIKNIKSTLKGHDDINISIHTAKSGSDTLEKAMDKKFDLLLMKQNMPGKNGIVVLQEIIKKKLGVPVIMIVAEGEEKLGVKALESGAYDYLTRNEVKTAALNRAIRRAMQRKKLENDISRSLQKLEKLAIRDGLTGLYNHRHFLEVIGKEYKKSSRHVQPLSCMMIDLDYFKSVNDNHGHQFGDHVLVESARILMKLVRDTDFVARYGGEEFFVVLPNTFLQGALILAERIRNAFEKNTFKDGKASEVVTVSIGLSSIADDNVTGAADLVSNADKALYRAKAEGRNRVVPYDDKIEESSIIKEEYNKLASFNSKLEAFQREVKERCIESAHKILCEIETGWGTFSKHSVRVSRHAEKLSRELAMSDDDVDAVKRAALLHDIGMIGVNSRILHKRSKLTADEYNLIKRHSNMGVKLMEKTRLFERELPMILHHHERVDGNGYPQRLRGDSIPAGARVLAIADAYDAMRTNSSYSKSRSASKAITELKKCAGTQFDPRMVDVFIDIIKKNPES
jgi:diguanylate cyclase (GGDEF)-like protein/putative nucleotidyltransferase with HDIG domain